MFRFIICLPLFALPVASFAQEAATPQWIWIHEDDQPVDKVYLRREFDSGGVASARLYVTADDRMKAFIDGKPVIESDNWRRPLFVDLSKQIDLDDPEKQHVLAIEAENAGGPGGLVVKLDLGSGWRKSWSVVSDTDWQASTKAQRGWKTIGFKPNDNWRTPDVIAELGQGPWAKEVNAETLAAAAALKEPTATAVEDLKVAEGFQVELLYSVPKDEQGSWVNMCVDPKGRLIVSDQYGSLYRVTPPGISGADEIVVEKVNVDIGEAQGLLWAFDSLYVSVNKGENYHGGLYRVRDTDGDDQLDSVDTLRLLNGSGEHGPHAVLPHPDGKSLVIVCGNRTDLTEITSSRVPTWDEDLLLPRVKGKFMMGTRAPGGCIYRIDPDGKEWELLASGFRNQYDAAFNREGELFAYDADMEWDINTPWYRPTRICHVVSGADFGWRSGAGKWPTYYPDSIPPVINIGPGSPTGVCFGYGAKFPEKYQNALYAADWSYGKLYAVHLEPTGATYGATLEEFVTGTPLPLTDMIINSHDGAMYFLIGGRRVQSGLYRVTASDQEVAAQHDVTTVSLQFTKPSQTTAPASIDQALRRRLEETHADGVDPTEQLIRKGLSHEDRFIRHAARIALEHVPIEEWQEEALSEDDPQTLLTVLLGLARSHDRPDMGESPDIDTPIPAWDMFEANLERSQLTSRVLEALDRLDFESLSHAQKIELLRVLTLTFVRIAPPNVEERDVIVNRLDDEFPAESQPLNSEIAQLMVYLQAPYAAGKLIPALENAPTQEEQIDYARTLRHLTTGWTPELRERYFRWFTRAATYRGGASFQLFVNNIKTDAVANLTDEQKEVLAPILNAEPEIDVPVFTLAPRTFVKEWTMEELVPLVTNGLKNRNFEHGRQMFAAGKCFACHRFDNQGGAVGPDLTALSGRFSPRDLLESIIEPSKQISDQYGSVQIITIDGKTVSGRIINLAGDAFRIQTDMLNPGALTGVDRKQIEEMFESKTSMMPAGLLNTLNEEEILDLMAYLLSRGDRKSTMFGN